MPIKFRRNIAGIRSKQELVFAYSQEIRRLREHVQIAVFTEKGQGGDGAILEGNFLHLGDLKHIPETALLQNKLERWILQRPGPVWRHHDVSNPVAEL